MNEFAAVAGILVLVSAFLLPGYAWIVAAGLSRLLGWIGRLTFSFVISICLLSLLTSGLSLVSKQYLPLSLLISLGGSIALLGTHILTNRHRIAFELAFKTPPKVLAISLLAYACLLVASFWFAPYYPTAVTSDLVTHAYLTQSIVAGDGAEVLLHGNTPVALHFVAALVAYVLQIGALSALRIVTAPVVLAIVPLFFFSARKIFGSDQYAETALIVGAFVLPVDLLHYVLIGFYPNLLEDCIVLCLLGLLMSYMAKPSKGLQVSMVLLTLAGVFTHSSFFLFLAAAILSAPFVSFVASKTEFRNYLRGLLPLAAGLALLAVLVWPFFHGNLVRIVGSYIPIGQPRIPEAPYIAYMTLAWDLNWFLGYVNVFILIISVLFLVILRKKTAGTILTLLWLGILVISPGLSDQSYRFALFAMIPASFIIGNGLGDLRAWVAYLPRRLSTLRAWVVPVLFIMLILSGSLPSLMPRIINSSQRTREEAVYNSMQWLQKNQGVCTVVASSGLAPDYWYLSALTTIKYSGDFVSPPGAVLQESMQQGFSCVAIANTSTYFASFEADQSFVEIYHNNMIWIFKVNKSR